MEREQDRDGLYTWCSRMSDRITSQARESMKQALYCHIIVQPVLELDSEFRQWCIYFSITTVTPPS